MALSDRAEEILAKQLGNGRAAELRVALNLAYDDGGNDTLNARGRSLIANLFGRTRGEEFCDISDDAGLPFGSRVEEMLIAEFGASDGIELLGLFNAAYGEPAAEQNEAGLVFTNVAVLSGGSENQFVADNNDPENFEFQAPSAANLELIESFVGDSVNRTGGDVIILAGATTKIRAHVYSLDTLIVNTWSYAPKAVGVFGVDEAITVTRVAASDAYSPTYDDTTNGAPSTGKMTFDGASSLMIHNSVGGSTFAATLSPGDYVAIFKNDEITGPGSCIIRVSSASTGASHGTIVSSTVVDLSDFEDTDVVTLYKMVLA